MPSDDYNACGAYIFRSCSFCCSMSLLFVIIMLIFTGVRYSKVNSVYHGDYKDGKLLVLSFDGKHYYSPTRYIEHIAIHRGFLLTCIILTIWGFLMYYFVIQSQEPDEDHTVVDLTSNNCYSIILKLYVFNQMILALFYFVLVVMKPLIFVEENKEGTSFKTQAVIAIFHTIITLGLNLYTIKTRFNWSRDGLPQTVYVR